MLRTPITLSLAALLMSVSLISFSYAQEAEEAANQAEASPVVEDAQDVAEGDADAAPTKDVEEKESNIKESELGRENPQELPPIKPPSKEVQALNKAVADLTMPLDGTKRAHFFMLYNNHNLISTVKRVKGDVSNAIDSCSKENPDMETALRDRYAQWQEAVDEQLTSAEANVENMIIAQNYAEEKDIRSITKQADDLREETMRQVERVPVTTKEACDYLLNKMDETQANLVKLLKSTLVTLPKAMEGSNVTAEDMEDKPEDAPEADAQTSNDADVPAENVDADKAAPETDNAPAE